MRRSLFRPMVDVVKNQLPCRQCQLNTRRINHVFKRNVQPTATAAIQPHNQQKLDSYVINNRLNGFDVYFAYCCIVRSPVNSLSNGHYAWLLDCWRPSIFWMEKRWNKTASKNAQIRKAIWPKNGQHRVFKCQVKQWRAFFGTLSSALAIKRRWVSGHCKSINN